YAFAGLTQAGGQAAAYTQFQYPTASGDQSAQLLQGYALPQQAGPTPTGVQAAMFGAQSAASYGFDQSNAVAYSQAASVPMGQVGTGNQMPIQAGISQSNVGFPYAEYANSFHQYGGMTQGLPSGMQPGMGNGKVFSFDLALDMQQFNPLVQGDFSQMANNGSILEAIAQQQGLQGFSAAAFMQQQDSSGSGLQRSGGQMSGRGQLRGVRSNPPSITNPDGLREDTVFISRLPQNVDHEVIKSQFGIIGKIKTNSKSGMPMIWIFKERGVPKGDALVTYEDPMCVKAAIDWFSKNDFMNKRIDVRQATNSQRPVIIPPGGGGGGSGGISNQSQSQQHQLTNMHPCASGSPGLSGFGLSNSGANQQNQNAAALAAAAAMAAAAASQGGSMTSLMNSNAAAAAASLAALASGYPSGPQQGSLVGYNTEGHPMGGMPGSDQFISGGVGNTVGGKMSGHGSGGRGGLGGMRGRGGGGMGSSGGQNGSITMNGPGASQLGRGHMQATNQPTNAGQSGSKEGDWECSSCQNINFSWRQECNRC
ncbi:unnamed protein product, partial [Protopolystoma xenopodis]